MTRRTPLALALTALALVAAACGPKIGGREPAALYADYCARCHGADGRGDPEKVERNPDLDLTRADRTAPAARADVRERIASGHGSMPAFAKKLSADELEGLVDLVLTLTQPEGAEAPSEGKTSSPVGGGRRAP